MGKKILINYADPSGHRSDCHIQQKLNTLSGHKVGGFDTVINYGRKDIDADFYEKNRSIFAHKKGAGYWIWKPYIIVKTLKTLDEGDYLFYCDTDFHFVQSIDILIETLDKANQNMMIFKHAYNWILLEKHWTKRDLFIAMDCDNEKYTDTHQIQGGIHLWKKSDKSIKIAEEWLELVQNEHLLTNESSILGKPEYDGFVEHRHDQSIFSLICKRHNLIQSDGLYRNNIFRTKKYPYFIITRILRPHKNYSDSSVIYEKEDYIWFKRKLFYLELMKIAQWKLLEYAISKNPEISFRSRFFFFVYLRLCKIYLRLSKPVKRLMLFLK